MKKILYVVLMAVVFLCGDLKVGASSGQLRKASIKSCNGITYGQHSSDNHWHVAEEQDGKYYATGDSIYSDPCSSNVNNKVQNNNSSNQANSFEDKISSNENVTNNVTSNQSSSSSSHNTVDKVNNSNKTEQVINKSSDNTLKEVTIDGQVIEVSDDMEFSTTKQNVIISVVTNDEKASYEIKNKSYLSIGDNQITIEVKAEDETIKVYNININRRLILSSDKRINIVIDGETVEFDNYKATVYVSSSATTLDVDYTLSDDKAKVEMTEISDLKTGDNELKIKVIAEDGSEQVYDIIVHKSSKAEDIISTILAFLTFGGMIYGVYFIVKKIKERNCKKTNV